MNELKFTFPCQFSEVFNFACKYFQGCLRVECRIKNLMECVYNIEIPKQFSIHIYYRFNTCNKTYNTFYYSQHMNLLILHLRLTYFNYLNGKF